jgi:serine protease
MRISTLFFCFSVLALLGMAGPGFASVTGDLDGRGRPVLVEDEIVVVYNARLSGEEKAKIRSRFGLQHKGESYRNGRFTVYKTKNPKKVLKALRRQPGVLSVRQNSYAYADMVPNDPYYSLYQWNMKRLNVEQAWDYSNGQGVIIAVVDTGVRQSLEDLQGQNFVRGYDFVNSDDDPTDDQGHGSHVAGTIAQATNNGVGVAGVAFGASIMPVKVLDSKGSGTYTQIIDGIDFAVDNGAHIINLSLGGSSGDPLLEAAVNDAWARGVVVVCAAGNDGDDGLHYPSAYENAISVSATTREDTLASYSNYGATVDISAPGGDGDYLILQNTFDRRSEGYFYYAGTSMATPHVAGAAALLKSFAPQLSNVEIRAYLENYAEDLGSPGWDQSFGHGLVDPVAALEAMGDSPAEDLIPPVLSNFSESDVTTGGARITWVSDEPADSELHLDEQVLSSAALVTSHEIVLTGLTPDTEYSYTVRSTDAAGNTAESAARSFRTLSDVDGDLYAFVADIEMSVAKRGRNSTASATVHVADSAGGSLTGAVVSGIWSGLTSGYVAGTTGSDGSVTFTSARTKNSGTFTFTVTDVQSDIFYDAGENLETSDSIDN